MSVIDERALCALIVGAVREAIRAERPPDGAGEDDGYLDGAAAARVLAVTPPTIGMPLAMIGRLTHEGEVGGMRF